MVVTKELAVLFKRNKIDEYVEEFIPFKVVEGKYDINDRLFIDTEGFAYLNIAEPVLSGICYGNRLVVEIRVDEEISDGETIEEKINECTEATKKQILETFNKITLKRDVKDDWLITVIDNETGNEYEFLDGDSELIYDELEELETEGNYQYEEYTPEISLSPIELVSKVKETIKGQDEAIKKIVTSIWTSIKFNDLTKKNMLIIGPSGVGKTAIFKKLQKILDIPVTIFPVSGLSQAGYAGRSTDEIFAQIYYENNRNIRRAEKSIIILDEIDKLAYGSGKTGDISTTGVQNELLKIIEGCNRTITVNDREPTINIDTSKIIFVGIGAFSELYEKEKTPIGFDKEEDKEEDIKNTNITTEALIKYGLKRELLGRLPIVVELNPMTENILKDIVLESDESELKITLQALNSLGVNISNLDELIDLIVKDALNKKIGARGLVTTINNIFLNIFYKVANNPDKYREVIIGKDILKDPEDFKLVPRRTKKKVKTKTVAKTN